MQFPGNPALLAFADGMGLGRELAQFLLGALAVVVAGMIVFLSEIEFFTDRLLA